MHSRLTSGDTTYHLQDAQSLKSEIAHQAELLDVLSKKIAALPTDPESPRNLSLQNSVRRSITNFIRETILMLPNLPTQDEIDGIKLKRLQKHTVVYETAPSVNIKRVAVTTGWSSSANVEKNEDLDPLLEQISNVQLYISEAQEAHRWDEVGTLRENLKMLEEIYKRQQNSLQGNLY